MLSIRACTLSGGPSLRRNSNMMPTAFSAASRSTPTLATRRAISSSMIPSREPHWRRVDFILNVAACDDKRNRLIMHVGYSVARPLSLRLSSKFAKKSICGRARRDIRGVCARIGERASCTSAREIRPPKLSLRALPPWLSARFPGRGSVARLQGVLKEPAHEHTRRGVQPHRPGSRRTASSGCLRCCASPPCRPIRPISSNAAPPPSTSLPIFPRSASTQRAPNRGPSGGGRQKQRRRRPKGAVLRPLRRAAGRSARFVEDAAVRAAHRDACRTDAKSSSRAGPATTRARP